MATLEKIRSKGLLLLIVVGLALVVFIVGDLVNSGSTYFQENSANVAVINGDKVKIRDYAEKMDQFNDVVKLQYGNNINDEMTEQIRQMVWESTVTEKVIGDECENIGMMITKNELADMLVGNNISPMMMNNQMFFNENGQFDVNVVKQFITMLDSEEATQNIPYEQLRLYRNYWRYWEHAIKTNRLQEKYTNLLNAALVVNPLEAQYAYDNAKVSADAVYAMKNYFAIADSTINVSDAEIKALYNKKKEQFKQKQSADVKYMFGVLTSNVHMAWMRTVCGRMKSDYSYSTTIVYNCFPWPTPTDEQKAKIEQTAQAILDARALYPDCSLADLYDELTMPVELRKAHQANDKAVMQAYGFWGKLNTESECVAELMRMYKELTEETK